MFAYKDRKDKKLDITYRDYYLTQGDSFTLTATPNGTSDRIIDKIVFKMNTVGEDENDLTTFFEQNYELVEGVYYMICTPTDTAQWQITGDNDPYVYEIEIHFIDGGIETVEQANFTVWRQGQEEV